MMKFLEALRISAQQVRLNVKGSGLFKHKRRKRRIQRKNNPRVSQTIPSRVLRTRPRRSLFCKRGVKPTDRHRNIRRDFLKRSDEKREKPTFPCESVFGSIEVKTELKGETLEQGVENIVSLKKLNREASDMMDILPFRRINVGEGLTYGTAKRNHYLGVIFAYKGLAPHTVVDYLEEQSNDPEKRMVLPDFVFNLERGYVVLRCKTIKGRKIARFFGEDYDGYGPIVLGEDTLPLFYLTVNTF